LVAAVAGALPADVEVVGGSTLAGEAVADLDADFLGFLRTFLVVFAVIALVVASFSIHNTFSILAAQRTRSAALLRALGATRRQVLTSMLIEALAVGIVATATGVVGGLGAAGALKGIFDAAGFALPAGGLVVSAASLGVAAATGLLVTVVAGLAPALRASQVAPLAALRDVAIETVGGGRVRTLVGVGMAVAAAFLLPADDLPLAGAGALLLVLAALVLGPVIARPVAGAIGRPVAALRGLPGELARENAVRSPRRTASTASALMVGVGVVVLFTVLAASVKASVEGGVARSLTGDLILSTGRFDGGIDPSLASEAASVEGVDVAVGLGLGRVLVDGQRQDVTVADTGDLDAVLDLGVADGALGPDVLGVSQGLAQDNGWSVGSEVPVTFVDGAVERLAIGAVYERADLVRSVLVPRGVWERHALQSLDGVVLVAVDDGATVERVAAALGPVAARHAVDEVLDGDGYAEQSASGVDMALGLVYVLLALAIVIALLGISNTLSLAVHERTRELGLLRALGASRRQVRAMVRWESVVVALLGTASGLVLGLLLARALVAASSFGDDAMTFAVPGTLVVVVVAGAFAGVAAAVRPARRAARLDVLDALASV
jgi:putative ABC transport system permease protein